MATVNINATWSVDQTELHICLFIFLGHLFYCLAEAPKPEVSETASRSSKTPAASVNGGDSRKSSAAIAKPFRKTSAGTKVRIYPALLLFSWKESYHIYRKTFIRWVHIQEGDEDGATAIGAEGGEEEAAEEDPQGADIVAAADVAAHVLDNVLISAQEYEDLKKRWLRRYVQLCKYIFVIAAGANFPSGYFLLLLLLYFAHIVRLRQGFLDHLDSWSTEALDRANSVVTSKTEELNSELDLKASSHRHRYYQWKPRCDCRREFHRFHIQDHCHRNLHRSLSSFWFWTKFRAAFLDAAKHLYKRVCPSVRP